MVGSNLNASKKKGSRGEALVRLMFEWHGCQVLEFGVEKHFPRLMDRGVKLHQNALGTKAIRSFPDFLVVREKKDGLHPTYVEVKTHKTRPSAASLEHYAIHGAVCVVWVGPQGVQYTWVIEGNKGIDDFLPIERLRILEAEEDLIKPIHDLSKNLHGTKTKPSTRRSKKLEGAPTSKKARTRGKNSAPGSAQRQYYAKKKAMKHAEA